MKSIKSMLMGGAILLGLTMCLTSCEGTLDDIFGEWSRPTGNNGNTKTTVAVKSVTLDQTTLTKAVGDAAVTLTATVDPTDATNKTVTWTSSDTNVATVTDGVVNFVASGTTTITATATNGTEDAADDKTATCEVTVTTAAKVTTAPTATTGYIFSSDTTPLITEGVADGGTMMYEVTTTNTKPTATDGFSATVPTAAALAAATYYVWYYVKADATHTDSEISASAVEVTVTDKALGTPLTIEAITGGTIVVSKPRTGMQYSLNGGTKTTLTADPTNITVTAGDKVQFYGNGTTITAYYSSGSDYTNIKGSDDSFTCKVYGNIMSLLDEENFVTTTKLTASNTFNSLFKDNTNLTDASNLQLPATTLAEGCYREMFKGCIKMASAPVLPATDLEKACYYAMFYNTALTTTPVLLATTLKDYCYMYMFSYCASLTETPHVAATSLASNCYYAMFEQCTGLKKAYVKAACSITYTDYMFNGCTDSSTSTFYSDDVASYKTKFTCLASWQDAAYE